MFKFPEGLYTDVRIEDVYRTNIRIEGINSDVKASVNVEELKVTKEKGAFIRIFDGERWFYSSTSDIPNLQKEIDSLKKLAKPCKDIKNNPIVKKLQVNRGSYLKYSGCDIREHSKEEKKKFLEESFDTLKAHPSIKMWRAIYIDNKKIKKFYSSLGADLEFDYQTAGFSINMGFSDGDKRLNESYMKTDTSFEGLMEFGFKGLEDYIKKCEDYMSNSVKAKPKKYTVILSPLAAGIFAHESFGHKSEADFMVGDENMKREWAIGKKVGADILSILDTGEIDGSGFVPFDDEGTSSNKTYLVKDGKLSGRLHSAATAESLNEDLTGNARSINFEFEPIVRMTTTYILPGEKSKEELFKEVKEGIYVETVKHGSGMSTFTIAPSRSYLIKDGKIDSPLEVSVISGDVFETLNEIDGLSDKLELMSFVTGGCGKMEQYPLPVGFGGPYVRVRNLNVQ